ncbi:alpha-amylase family glycosyl hydrolase [Lentzea sp. BCCO 10_0856]|uniref:Alpha-amylase family glycosyl hydrolase n=1 Tax=Lentzea miocenica TaxID=3095431 RepID=A0ABU4T4G4_9PSEU|nr:alpha-amylase family glycosyl hydrolase [Lentzea sp. BCCO 10_0856]MDX8032995.1 alpha-amylase family glycosyl hydrolase [Lentzea sp. BCCO 10_0856]
MRRSSDLSPEIAEESAWWRDAVFYQVYVRSFADSNGDGVGDLDGIRSRLGYLELLGVDALWLTPFYRSPMADHGYDVADPRDVDPLFGDLAAFDRLVADAHEHNIRVTVDLVPNHTSDLHEWFQEALQAGPGSMERSRYVFREGRGFDGSQPPNNWVSVFGGPAWTRVPDGQWYLHLFAPEQPDLNWDHPEVRADLEHTLRFWLDRGVDGFRIDVAHGMAKPEGLPDMEIRTQVPGVLSDDAHDPRFDNDGVHEIHRMIRKVMDGYPGTMAVGEIWVKDDERFAAYVRPDELHLGFNFRLVEADFDADAVRSAIEHSLGAVALSGTPATWTLSNHDVVRHVTRYGGGALGEQRARAMTLVELALPGVIYLYNGEELGLPNVELPDWALQDPTWERSGHTERGRDGCRVPIPWEGTTPPFGFSTAVNTWLPQPNEWDHLTAEAQLEDPGSMLSLYREALEHRKSNTSFAGEELEWYGAPAGCFAFRRKGGGLICALNTSGASVPLPPGQVLLSSGPMDGDQLPPDTAVWLA